MTTQILVSPFLRELEDAEAAIRRQAEHNRDAVLHAARTHDLDPEEVLERLVNCVVRNQLPVARPTDHDWQTWGLDHRFEATLAEAVRSCLWHRKQREQHRRRAEECDYVGDLYDRRRSVEEVAKILRNHLKDRGLMAHVLSEPGEGGHVIVFFVEEPPVEVVSTLVCLARRYNYYYPGKKDPHRSSAAAY